MSTPTKTKAWVLQNKALDHTVLEGANSTFALKEQDIPELKDGQILVKALYISNDPAQRGWIDANINPEELYVTPIQEGEVMRATGIAEVIESKSDDIKKGTLVTTQVGWREFIVVDAKAARPLRDIKNIKPTQYLGAFGGTGLTAYVGLIKITEAKKGDVVVVSGAAGATGSMVVQLAKHVVGASKVVALAGTDEKCKWVESLGADVAINYKHCDWLEKLKKATEGGVDVYFDNVAGVTLDFMLTRMKNFGRIAACGAISNYNKGEKDGLKNWLSVVMNRINIKGFVVLDHLVDGNVVKFTDELLGYAKEGKIKVSDSNETVVDTKFEDIPKTWTILFNGGNQGKLVTKLV